MDEEKYIGLTIQEGRIEAVDAREKDDVSERKIRINTKSIVGECTKRVLNHLTTHDILTNSDPKEKPDYSLMSGNIVFYCKRVYAERILLEQARCYKNIDEKSAIYEQKKYALNQKLEYEKSIGASPEEIEQIEKEIVKVKKKIEDIRNKGISKLHKTLISKAKSWKMENFANIAFKQFTCYKGSFYQENGKELAHNDFLKSFGGFINLERYAQLIKEKGYIEGIHYTDESISKPLVFLADRLVNSRKVHVHVGCQYAQFAFAGLHTKRASYGKVKALKELKDKKTSN